MVFFHSQVMHPGAYTVEVGQLKHIIIGNAQLA